MNIDLKKKGKPGKNEKRIVLKFIEMIYSNESKEMEKVILSVEWTTFTVFKTTEKNNT